MSIPQTGSDFPDHSSPIISATPNHVLLMVLIDHYIQQILNCHIHVNPPKRYKETLTSTRTRQIKFFDTYIYGMELPILKSKAGQCHSLCGKYPIQ